MLLLQQHSTANTLYDAAVTKNSFPGWYMSNFSISKIAPSH